MNTARNRNASALALELSALSTDELVRITTARRPERPSRYLNSMKLRLAARAVLMARQITQPKENL